MGGRRRNNLVDFVRGLALLDMMAVHYSPWLDWSPQFSISKVLNYFDFAVEGFILLAGFVVGSCYLEPFVANPIAVIKKLLYRVASIVGLHYVMILTLSLPIAALVGARLTRGESLQTFAMQSFLFLNQVPLIHILPTFIPLFLLAIPILYLLRAGQDFWLIVGSLVLFGMGNWLSDLGEPLWGRAIFPAPLWQTFFVAGTVLGKHQDVVGHMLRRYAGIVLGTSMVWLAAMLFIYHGHHVSSVWRDFQSEHGWFIQKFPLNMLGWGYHAALLCAVVAVSAASWSWLKAHPLVSNAVASLGRNSLILFVVHVYFCFVLDFLLEQFVMAPAVTITMNGVGAFVLSALLDARRVGWMNRQVHRV